jgi:hypothetical protein
MFSQTKSALIKAVKQGHLTTFPGLTEDATNKYLRMTPATAMGHVNQKSKSIRSTSNEMQVPSDLEYKAVTPIVTGEKTALICAAAIDQGRLYTDFNGRFPLRSRKGNWYVMVVSSFDCNYIKPVAMKTKSSSEWLK